MWVSSKKYERVRKVLERQNKIRYCTVALHIVSYCTIKFGIILIAYYIDDIYSGGASFLTAES